MYVFGNWKMHLTLQEATTLASQIRQKVELELAQEDQRRMALFVPFPFLVKVAEVLEGSPIGLGAQNMHQKDEGAFTGEVSAKMLTSVGCTHVLLGHSERRQYFRESDEMIAQKLAVALAFQLTPVVCVGETLEERQSGRAEEVVGRQIREILQGFSAQLLAPLVLAYEPVWAIGTGKAATPEDVAQMHSHIRREVGKLLDLAFASRLPILYGGSVKAKSAPQLAQLQEVNGFLVGGASLRAEEFCEIAKVASQVSKC